MKKHHPYFIKENNNKGGGGGVLNEQNTGLCLTVKEVVDGRKHI